MIGPVWVVQDKDTGQFLCPLDGDVGFTKFLSGAGRFDNPESAIDTARFILGNSFVVCSFFDDVTKCYS
ncbi:MULTISPECIES: hypothetical protein [Chromobacteriaceae]|uniref:Uncharacterized protein n=3 Tax=Chromobacteriaceae TaxID=1499392 RepID=A0AAX2M949_CHRVL|nr:MULTISPECIES: hypothetical protein [Chromobacteriaceae]MBX9346651.1 hypothetical protein [Chromobacterium vaccinii]ERE14026.1 hypothetical protein O166_00245 [Pseudogulbenkiania ferrooxidans EGD-HP2]MBP4049572.1 hypothetical protein [Chromobacterium violaceum]OLZ63870.1 hypothetical protein BS642_21890 [Chromobacterium violaceum]OQS28748.1 hypothetical protein B0T41_05050 [Chromobacterium violaceum]